MVIGMARDAMFCSFLMVIFCPAAVQMDRGRGIDGYYDMTNRFLDVVQPEPFLGGKNSNVALQTLITKLKLLISNFIKAKRPAR